MATSKKSVGGGGRGKAPSKAAASKGGRASGGGTKKSASGGSSRGGASSKAAAPKKAAASKSTGGRSAAGATEAAARSGRAAGGARGGASKATASKKATATRGGGARGAAGATAAASRGGRGSGGGRGGATTASRGRSGAASSRARGAQQSADPRNDLEKLMVDGLKDIYYAEKVLSKALTRMAKNATNGELRAAFETHRDETDEQVRMLEGAFQTLGQKVQGKKCAAMDGLIEEGKEHMEEASKGAGRDAVMLVSAQKSEHYEIAAYGSLRTFAQSLGNNEVAQIFQTILDQEKATDEKLTGIAETVNREALGSHEDTDGGGEDGGSGRAGNEGGGSGGGNEGGSGSNGRADVAPTPAETLDITA